MNTIKKLLFIYNARSGKAKIKTKLVDILDTFTKAGYQVTAYPTQESGDATRAVIEREPGYDRIVCSGGDGTLDEVVFGMMKSDEKLPIGYIPAGSTNDFGHSLGVSNNMVKAAEGACSDTAFSCDIGSLNQDFFVYVAAFGIFTEVTYATPQNIKNTLGHTAYILEAIRSLPTIQNYHLRVTWEEGSLENDFIYGMVTNSMSVGGFKGITGHHVFLDDGYFEVTLIRAPATPADLNDIVRAMLDRRIDSENIITFKSKHVVFESETPISWTRDGEYGGTHTTAEVNVYHKAIDFLH